MLIANLLIGLCAVFIVLNWIALLAAMIQRRSYSFAPPFLCGVVACIASLMHPAPAVNALAWVSLVADPSIVFALGWTAVVHLRKKFRER